MSTMWVSSRVIGWFGSLLSGILFSSQQITWETSSYPRSLRFVSNSSIADGWELQDSWPAMPQRTRVRRGIGGPDQLDRIEIEPSQRPTNLAKDTNSGPGYSSSFGTTADSLSTRPRWQCRVLSPQKAEPSGLSPPTPRSVLGRTVWLTPANGQPSWGGVALRSSKATTTLDAAEAYCWAISGVRGTSSL